MKTDSSLTDVSSLSIFQINSKQTCSCSTCTCSNNSPNKIKSDFFENNDDYLTYIFIILYECSIWCIQIIYELFFKSLWQVVIYIKQELQYSQNDNKIINRSASGNYSLMYKKQQYSGKLSGYHWSLLEARNRLSRRNREDKMHCTVSNSSPIDIPIVIVPVRSSHCQTEISKNDLETITIDLNQAEKKINLSEELTDTSCHRLDNPLIFTSREVCFRYNRTSFVSTVPSAFDHLGQHFSQQRSSENRQLSPYQSNKIASALSSNNRTNFNTALSPTSSALPASNILNQTSSSVLPNPTEKTSFSNNSEPFLLNHHQRKSSQKKSKQKRRIIDDNSIPLELATSLHSNMSLYNQDSFLTTYIHQLLIDKHHLR